MTIASLLRTALPRKAITGAIAIAATLGCANLAYATPTNRDIAWKIFERLTGTPPSNAMLDTMTDCITNGVNSGICQNGTTVDGVTSHGVSDLSSQSYTGTSTMPQSLTAATNNSSSSTNLATNNSNVNQAGIVAATFLAMQDPNFLNVKVKDMVLPWTNKDQTVFFPFNDAAALMIGMIRDGTDFRKVLYDNIYYYDPNAPTTDQLSPYEFDVAQYSVNEPTSNNNHFEYIENQNLPLKTTLVEHTQSGLTGNIPTSAIAGVLTTRAMQRAYFYAGTNRAMIRFTFLNFLCNDLPQVKDINSNPERARQDPSRSPGGNSYVFLNKCVGCHAGMDGMDGAFAYYNWGSAIYNPNPTTPVDSQGAVYAQSQITNGQNDSNGNPEGYVLSGKVFPPSRVMPKFRQNFLSFPGGYYTTDDSWINYWRVGADANLGWAEGANDSAPKIVSSDPSDPNGMGSAAQLGYELSHTVTFARCQVLHVYRHTCMNDPTEPQLKKLVTDFQNSQYNMLAAYSDAAIACSSN